VNVFVRKSHKPKRIYMCSRCDKRPAVWGYEIDPFYGVIIYLCDQCAHST